MKKLLIFVLISVVLHILLLLIEFPESEGAKKTKVEIIRKERPPVTAELPETPDNVSPPQQVLPDTPEVDDPTTLDPQPQPVPIPVTDPVVPVEPQPQPVEPVIVPENYDPDKPPAPMTFNELLEEQINNSDPLGPDRNINDVVREYLENNTDPDDSVSFHNMLAKYDSYFNRFARSLYGEWRYPIESAQRGEKGIVRVTFSITREGRIINVNILESSGYAALDKEVLRTLRDMADVPLPESYDGELLNINGYFIYTQQGSYRLY